jgi:RNA polymerase sigma factor (sigma-70 family)
MLLRFLTRKVGSQEAQDLAHEVMLRAGRTEATIDNERAYLFRIATNLVTDHIRAERRRGLLSAAETNALLDVADDTPGPERIAMARSEIELLKTAVAEMPARRAEILRLSRIEGLSHPQIATRLGVSLRTVEAEIRMALDHCATRVRGRPRST